MLRIVSWRLCGVNYGAWPERISAEHLPGRSIVIQSSLGRSGRIRVAGVAAGRRSRTDKVSCPFLYLSWPDSSLLHSCRCPYNSLHIRQLAVILPAFAFRYFPLVGQHSSFLTPCAQKSPHPRRRPRGPAPVVKYLPFFWQSHKRDAHTKRAPRMPNADVAVDAALMAGYNERGG